MNEYLKALILSLVQGLTEFLPVSSSGHLVLLGKLGLAEDQSALFFNLMLHLGTLMAVCFAYRKKLLMFFKHPTSEELLKLLAATIPTVFIAALFKYVLPQELLGGKFVAFGFMITSILLILSEIIRKKGTFGKINYKNSIVTGIVQGIAVLPGISRSGSTIAAMRFFNVSREEAADFSFLLSIPVILGGALIESVDMFKSRTPISWGPVIVGVAVSFISGFIAIKFFLKFIKRYSFIPFALYTAVLAIVCLIVL